VLAATSYAMRTQNNINHIFDPKHNLGNLTNELGGQRQVILTTLKTANGLFPSSGVFRFSVGIRGNAVWLEGIVQNGMPKLGSMWIP